MAFVITLLLLLFGIIVGMLFQTRMQQQDLAEKLSRLQTEVEKLRRRPPVSEQKLPENAAGESPRSTAGRGELPPSQQGGLYASARSEPHTGASQPDFGGWPYNPDVPTAAASGATRPHFSAYDSLSPATSARLPADAQPADVSVHPLAAPSAPSASEPTQPPFSGSLTPEAAAAPLHPQSPVSPAAPASAAQPAPAASGSGVVLGSRPGTVKIRKRVQPGEPHLAPTPAQPHEQAAARAPSAETGQTASQARRAARRAEPQRESAFAPLVDWLMHGNLLLKTGIVVLFLGLVFLLRFASERIHVPIEMRYLSVMGSGLAAAVAGWVLQRRRREYGLILQGFGMAVMYLTVLAAVKLHPLLPSGTAFVLMVALVCAMALMAVRQDAKIMAQVALIGGLAAPMLVSDGSGSHVVLFTYLALLNTGVAAIARFKTWRSLNLIGFIGTLAIALMWGTSEYTVERFASTEPFLLYHWLLYTLVACLYALHRRDEAEEHHVPDNADLDELADSLLTHGMIIGAIDGMLLFGTAAAAFMLQYHMLPEGANHLAAGASLGFAGVYTLLAAWFTGSRDFPLLRQALGALSLVFVTLAVPLAFEREATVALWSLEAGLVYVFALRQRRPYTRVLAALVYLLSLGALLGSGFAFAPGGANEPLLDGPLASTFAAALAGLVMYAAWLRWRCRGSAYWEAWWQQGVLGAGLLLTGLLPLMSLLQHWAMAALAALAWAAVRAQAELFRRFAGNADFSGSLLAEEDEDEGNDEADDSPELPVGLNLLLAAALGYGTAVLPLLGDAFGMAGWAATAACWAATLLLGAAGYALHHTNETAPGYRLPENERSEFRQSKRVARLRNQHLRQNSGGLPLNQGAGGLLTGMALFGTLLSAANLLGHLPEAWADTARLWYLLLPFALWAAAVAWLDWRQGRRAALLLIPLMPCHAMWLAGWLNRVGFAPYAFSGSLMLVLLALLLFAVLRMQRFGSPETERAWGVAAFMLWAAQATGFAGMLGGETLPGVWAQLAWLGLPLALWLLFYLARERDALRPYAAVCSLLCGMYALLWLVGNNVLEPRAVAPLGYWPLLNPMDLAGLAVGALWLRSAEMWQEDFELEGEGLRLHLAGSVLAGLTLVSGAVLRLWYFYMGVEWTLPGIMASFGLQAALSIVWASAAIGLMVSGHRSGRRIRWMAGAGLMGVVVLKLFTVELGGSGGIARIVSFIGVGLLLLLVGWFAPVPPREGD
ncbi:hypothetical protein A7P95_05505 [Eikenella longinqua]|uniref:Beta-carotene 15,15'-monooxygenase n=1 Tax=Eikenella longinqua TaxID=1795827 RepID=A0A1A9RY09_9NEIS|nr:DUF2339 domain-containing protein [Eikenella longinqua]OAM28417.1 hypothetical protein A7P95_05505 [Eikenella longinqua]